MGDTRDEIVKFFKLVVNPALEGCGSDLEGRGWTTDKLQIPDPENPVSWVNGKLTSLIDASKAEGETKVRFVYTIWVEGSGDDYNISHQMDQYKGSEIKNRADSYDISNATQDSFCKEIRTFYKIVEAQPAERAWK